MVKSILASAGIFLFVLPGLALAQNLGPLRVPGPAIAAPEPPPAQPDRTPSFSPMLLAPNMDVPNTIAYVPSLAKAILGNDIERLNRELAAGAKVDEPVRAQDGARAGFTPLILAAALSEPEIVRTLIKYGSSVSVLDDFHRSAFWYVALKGNVEIARVLSEARGARDAINAADNDLQRTPLHLAVRGNAPELVSLLLGIGASREQKDVLGEMPVDFCKRQSTNACKALQ